MALKTCPHCGHNVSDKATKCPQCGKDPRFTDLQLEQQEQQRKKKRKTAIIIFASVLVVVFAALCAIFIRRHTEYSRQLKDYNEAQILFDSGKYYRAAKAFDALGEFKDSAQKALDSRYQYVYTNQIRTNNTTLKYIEYLTEKNYPNIQSLSRSIYAWKCKAYVTDAETGSPTTKTFGTDSPLYFILQVYGGKPNEEISVKYKVILHASSYAESMGYTNKTEYGTVSYKLSDGKHHWTGWPDGIGTSMYSRVSITFYNADTGEVLATANASIQS